MGAREGRELQELQGISRMTPQRHLPGCGGASGSPSMQILGMASPWPSCHFKFALYLAELAAELHGRISLPLHVPLHVPFPLLRMLFPPLFPHQTLIHHSSLQPGALF